MDKGFDSRFPIKLKMLRLEKGLSQEAFALLVGISRSCLANYETGKRQPDMTTIQQIADRCNVPITVLIDDVSCMERVFSESSSKRADTLKAMLRNRGNQLDISHLSAEYRICMIEYYNYVSLKYHKKNNHNIAR